MTATAPKILLLGKDSQLGWELQRALSTIGPLVACDRQTANFENADELRFQIRH
ncbi:sugar nucleotide-binding protein, partial [Klebsiella pneumoniae]|nr:sugar nucleotide-binding protein [Klebsiella pneumoniae]